MNTSASMSMSGTSASLRATGAVAFTVLSWAAAFPFIRLGLHGLSPMQLAAARFATAAVLVVGLACLSAAEKTFATRFDALRPVRFSWHRKL